MALDKAQEDGLVGKLRSLFDDIIIPRMKSGELTVDIRPIQSKREGDQRVSMVLSIQKTPAIQLAGVRRELAGLIAEAFTVELPALGKVDLAQQRNSRSRSIEINFFTDNGHNEFIDRVRKTNELIKHSSGMAL